MNPTSVAKQQRQQDVESAREEVTRLRELVRSLQDGGSAVQSQDSSTAANLGACLPPPKEVLGKILGAGPPFQAGRCPFTGRGLIIDAMIFCGNKLPGLREQTHADGLGGGGFPDSSPRSTRLLGFHAATAARLRRLSLPADSRAFSQADGLGVGLPC